MVERESTLV